MVKPIKQKRGQSPGKSINKQAKKNWAAFDFYHVFGLFEVRVIKALAWKSCDFLTNPTAIHQNFYLSSFNFIFEIDSSQLQPYAQGIGFPPQYSHWVRRFFTDNFSI